MNDGLHPVLPVFDDSMDNLKLTSGLRKLGAVDYVTKPVSWPLLLACIDRHLKLKASTDHLRDKAASLEAEVARQTREIKAVQDVMILAMATLAEMRNNEIGNHIRRTQHYVRLLAEPLKIHPRFKAYLNDASIENLFRSAPLHDIGKVGVPDRILLKPGRLDPDEFEIMRTHTSLGRDALERAEKVLGTPVKFLKTAKEIAYSHHEKWDGSGYPLGIGGDDIPVSARIMAVADEDDALRSRRVYKDAMTHEKAAAIIIEGKGSHFDPDVVDAFLDAQDEFRSIARQLSDSDEDTEDADSACDVHRQSRPKQWTAWSVK